MSKKVLFLLDHPKPEYFYDNQPDYGKTPIGKNLKHDLTFIGLRENVNYVFWYTYPEIPKALSVDKRGNVRKYKVPKASEIKDTLETLKQVVDTYDPSVIVPMGSLGTNLLLKSNITKQQGVATRVDVFGKDRWVFPIFSQDYIETFPDHKTPRDLAIGLLGRFIKKGDSAFIPERPNYFEVKSIEQAREVFAKPIETGEYSWDTEVNTLSPDKKGAKVLVISFCWAEGHGCAIPVGHCERYSSTGTTITGDKSYFTKADVAEIFDMLLNLSRAKIVGDIEPHIRTISNSPDTNPLYYKRLMKVGHNLTFDEHVLMSTGWAQVTDFVNNVDTKVGHFLEISQETGAGSTRKLSDLSFSLTSIGGYDKPLEEYKPWLIKTIKGYTDGKEKHRGVLGYLKDKIKETKDKNYQLNADDAKIIMAETQWDYLDTYNFNTPRVRDWVINKVAIPIVNRFRRASDIVATMNLEDIATSNDFNGDAFSYEWIPMDIMYYYASGDADASLRIHHALLDMMDANPLDQDGRVKNLYLNFYPQLVRTLANVEHTGIKVNNDYLTELAKTYRDKVEELNKSLRQYDVVKDLEDERLSLYQQGVEEFKKAPKDRNAKIFKYRNKYKNNAYAFSASKDADIADILYKNLGYTLPYDPKYIKKGTWDKRKKESAITWEDYKTDKFSLKYVEKAAKEAKDIHTAQFVHDLIQFSMIEKISNSFTDSLRKFMDSNDLLHGHFNATGTSTGRLSSNQINMQNIPSAKTDTHLYSYHHPVKRMFVSRFKDGKLLNIDYANLEFRILGLITHEESMTEAFLTGKDIHKANASLAYDVPFDEVTKKLRQYAKKIGFGLIYGLGNAALADQLSTTEEDAESKTNAFFKSKPRVKRFIDDTHTFVEKNGYVTTLNGFRRNLSGAFSRDYGIRASADRQSVNTIIQGSGAILTNTSLIILNDALHAANLKSCIVATVHDSIVIDCPLDEVDKVANLALYIMKNLNYPWLFTEYKGKRIRYPIDAEVEIGNTYNDMVDYDEDIHKFKTLDDYIDYMGKLSRISDAKESGDITEEQYDTIMKALPIT